MDQREEIRTILAELAEIKRKLRDAEFMKNYISNDSYADSLRDMDEFLDDMDYWHRETPLEKLDEIFDCIEISNQTKKLAEMEICWEWYERLQISIDEIEAYHTYNKTGMLEAA